MKLSIELSPAQADQLREEAGKFGLAPEQLAHAAVLDLLEKPKADVEAAISAVLEKNRELYRRLA